MSCLTYHYSYNGINVPKYMIRTITKTFVGTTLTNAHPYKVQRGYNLVSVDTGDSEFELEVYGGTSIDPTTRASLFDITVISPTLIYLNKAENESGVTHTLYDATSSRTYEFFFPRYVTLSPTIKKISGSAISSQVVVTILYPSIF